MYRKVTIPFDDLVQEGLIGLLEARKHYDPTKGASFSTYASFWIRKYMLTAIKNELKQSYHTVSLNEKVVADKVEESITTEDTYSKESITLPADMPEQEKLILRFHFEGQKTLAEIASLMGLPREKVRQLKQKALRRLRSSS